MILSCSILYLYLFIFILILTAGEKMNQED